MKTLDLPGHLRWCAVLALFVLGACDARTATPPHRGASPVGVAEYELVLDPSGAPAEVMVVSVLASGEVTREQIRIDAPVTKRWEARAAQVWPLPGEADRWLNVELRRAGTPVGDGRFLIRGIDGNASLGDVGKAVVR